MPTKKQLDFITVIIPFHKVDKYLELAIKSVLKSKRVSIEILLVDDRAMTKDPEPRKISELLDLINRSGHKVIVHTTKKRGYANALNESRREPTSDYVALMNSDDLISRNRLFNQIQNLKKGSDLEICKLVKFRGIFLVPSITGSIRRSFSPELLLLGAYGADATLCCRRETWAESFSYNESVRMADWELALRTFPNLKVGMSKNARYYYRMHNNQVSRASDGTEGIFLEIFNVWEAFSDKLGLPRLLASEAGLIAAPWQWRLEKTEIRHAAIKNWLTEFNKLPNTRQSNELTRLLRRRYAILWLLGFRYKLFIFPIFMVFVSYLIIFFSGAGRGV